MKKIIILFLFLLLSDISFSQSGWQSSFIFNADEISSVSKIDSNNIIAFTFYNNSCIRSSDGGSSWMSIKCFDTLCTIRDSKFTDKNTGWCVGETGNLSGMIYKTTNGGFNWSKIQLGTFYYGWWTLNFINNNTGWIGGYQNIIIKTTNGGLNWIQRAVPNILEIRGIKFLNENTGWICGRTNSILKTTNGGTNWIIQSPDIRDHWAYLMSINSVDSNNCWVTGSYIDSVSALRSFTARTTNGGTNWNTVYQEINTDTFLKVYFVNQNTGYLFGNRNYMLKTTNGGQNWITVNTGNYGSIVSADISNENHIIAGGGNYSAPNNVLISTTNGGNNWSILTINKYSKLNDIYFINQSTGFCTGENGIIYKTTNNGDQWLKMGSGTISDLNSINFVNKDSGFVFGSDGNIIKTTNGGNNWIAVPSPVVYPLVSSNFAGADTGWAVGADNIIIKTINGGNNWFFQDSPRGPNMSGHQFKSVMFLNNLTGFVLGTWQFGIPPGILFNGSSLLKTTNGGVNWVSLYDPWDIYYNKLTFLDINTGYVAANNYIYKTINGGTTWTSIFGSSNIFYDVKFINNNTGFAAGKTNSEYGVIYKTTNGGANWYQQLNEQSKPIYRIFVKDSLSLWCSGARNSIFKTTDGGGIISGINQQSEFLDNFSLSQNYPNPFNPTTNIQFNIQKNSYVELIIYDILGRQIKVLLSEFKQAGSYKILFDGTNFSSGIYFYKIIAGTFSSAKKMIIMK